MKTSVGQKRKFKNLKECIQFTKRVMVDAKDQFE